MASIPGVALNLTGASGSQGLLSPSQSWNAYVFPRGAYIGAASTGNLLTFDSSAIATRFAVNNWVQIGLNTANIFKVRFVTGTSSITLFGAQLLSVAQGDRVFIIGNTQPTVSGGVATYITPATSIYDRDDDGSNRQTNSMVTSNSDGLIRFYVTNGVYDLLIQDGNGTNQGYIADLYVGIVEGVSTNNASVYGSTVTVNANFGITGNFTGDTVTVNKALGVTGWATFGATVTMNAALGVTGTLIANSLIKAGSTITTDGAIGATGWGTFGATVTIAGALGVTGTGVIGATLTVSGRLVGVGASFSSDISTRRIRPIIGTGISISGFSLSAEWGSTATVTSVGGTDTAGTFNVQCGGASVGSTPFVVFTFMDGAFSGNIYPVLTRTDGAAPTAAYWRVQGLVNPNPSSCQFAFIGTPVVGNLYGLHWVIL